RAAIEPGVVQLSSPSPSVWGVFGAAAMVFFAFAGYARIATLGEEVTRPERNIPRAIGWALGLVVVVYVGMAVAMRHALPHDELVGSVAPVRDLAGSLGVPGLAVAVVATMAAAGSLVALMAGVGRTAMAMARQADAPRTWRRQGNSGAPWVAEGVSAL